MFNASQNNLIWRGHALLIGNSNYQDARWNRLEDIPLQLEALSSGLQSHFDTIEVETDLTADELRRKFNEFVRTLGNDNDARLFVYYAGHGYTEVIRERNENRGYITGIDTPALDGTQAAYNAARRNAISMAEIRAPLEEVLAKSILVLFDSCFAGTIFTNRTANDASYPLLPAVVEKLMDKPARDFITAGASDERVPAHSPIPQLFLAAINGAADRYHHGVISTADIHKYLFDGVTQMRDIRLTPQFGKLPNPNFAEGTFLFRIKNSPFQASATHGELLERVREFLLDKGYDSKRGVYFDPLPDKVSSVSRLQFSLSESENIIAVLTSTSSDDRIVFTGRAIYFRIKPFLREEKHVVTYEELIMRKPYSQVGTGKVIFSNTTLKMMPYIDVRKRDVLELLGDIRKLLIRRGK